MTAGPLAAAPLKATIVEAYEAMPPRLQAAARYILDRPDDVALLSMREQARRAGVPAATMTRLAKRLGLDGYEAVKALYAGALRDGTLGFAQKARAQVEAQKLRGERALAAEMAHSPSRQISGLAQPATPDPLAACAARGVSSVSACAPVTPRRGISTICCRCSATRR